MRTKSLILAAAGLAAGLLAFNTQAQNVFSLNVVGYANIPLTNGFNLVANNFDFDGSGTNNTVQTVVGTNMPNASKIYAFWNTTGSYSNSTYIASSRIWSSSNAVKVAMQPGNGFFLQIPATAVLPQTLTTVGNVLIGTNNVFLNVGNYQIAGSSVPIGGSLKTNLTYNAANTDTIYQWQPGSQSYTGGKHVYVASSGRWSTGDAFIKVGEGFWLLSHSGAAWSQVLTNSP
jgi:hypothetical protein